ncbi:phthiocerol/phthiodiolone dimycocerosyl transferase [Mycobacterium lacus]|uniref:Phthiocerol/phthiodiolone dimycocerosyl transferase n=1 Tax=Mycobacterium lacus TaxID=169765 RepID=A0A1X1YQR8_9MYCO|nr:phthiocerol/phthiodiolone dimycocerosyl transferase [Mycobacterium lacus]MCV7122087.1 phthiocerol/phthiodiolone dimycocerosyl transferase [Mycobacterium lacus]ORW13375.1 acyltransferase [Mycobacterium lacus]BBX97581.1 phthiocerol/phthiodiolone dimycocerosyl transferase [Mycobacterium lacus]
MFPGSVIRKLSHSEEVFAQYEVFTSMTIRLRGVVDVDALSEAFDALVAAHPVLASHLEPSPDGGWNLVADDLLHSGICVVDGTNGAAPRNAQMRLDQSVSLLNLRLTLHDGGAELTLFLHHSMADGHHGAALVDELFSRYTDTVSTGDPGPINPEPAPLPMEVLLEQRGIKKQGLSGAERFMPAMFAYELPATATPTVLANPGSPQAVPVVSLRLTKQETADLVAFGREHRLSLNTVVAAAILLTEWRLRETPHVPIPYVYPVDLRFLLVPPVAPTECTNLLGAASYLAEIGPDTDIVDLARDIVATLRGDLADGVIQQSGLHFGTAFEGTPPGLPPLVFCTDATAFPTMRTPPGIILEDIRGQFYCAITVPLDLYSCGLYDGQLILERHGHMSEPEKTLEAIRSLLCTVPSEYGWIME